MNRVKKASWWVVVMAGGLMLALPAVAVPKKGQTDCRGECAWKANAEVESCTLACPDPANPSAREAAFKCRNRCAEKFRATMESCDRNCPAPKKETQTH